MSSNMESRKEDQWDRWVELRAKCEQREFLKQTSKMLIIICKAVCDLDYREYYSQKIPKQLNSSC